MTDIEQIISASLLRLRMKSPFFATLALFTRFRPTPSVPTAATDGRDIFFNPEFVRSLPPPQVDGLLLHHVLHAALLHVPRRGQREPKLWNVAAEISVNGIIAQQGCFELPPDALRDPKLEQLSVEEIYELLLLQGGCFSNFQIDLLTQPSPEAPKAGQDGNCNGTQGNFPSEIQNLKPNNDCDSLSQAQRAALEAHSDCFSNFQIDLLTQPPPEAPEDGQDGNCNGTQGNFPSELQNLKSNNDCDSLAQGQRAALEAHWRNAMQQAAIVVRSSKNQGRIPAGMQREMGALTQAQLDWRSYLWRYLVRTPTDFAGFDRRFIGRKLYLEALESESVRVFVAVDTSGSIGNQQMQQFLNEVRGILSAYPHLTCELYYADAQVYGPHSLEADSEVPKPVGGGGTSFVPFFKKVNAKLDWHSNSACVYLTDGYGTFPPEPPDLPVLWVVTPGGLDLEQFPFGEAVRLLSEGLGTRG